MSNVVMMPPEGEERMRRLSELAMKRRPYLRGLAVKFFRFSPADADDVVNEALLFLVSHQYGRSSPDNPAGFNAYVSRQVIWQGYKYLGKFRPSVDLNDVPPELLAEAPIQAGSQVQDCFDELGPEDQQIIDLACFDGLSREEISAKLGITKEAAYTRLCRARQRLRRLMEGGE
jgi:RNA polymerase sigma factor (sigma-70 family)